MKRLYGAPVALENVGLVVNTRLAKVPTTFADLEKQALAFKKKKSGNLALAVPQGANGDAYHMYPFFSGLCGYVFGTNRAGNLDPSDIGVNNPRFLRNARRIDNWNKVGLINSKVDYDNAKNAFLKGKAAFWMTGPWESDTLKKSGLRFRIVGLPKPQLPVGAVPRRPGLHGHEVRRTARRRQRCEGPRRQLHDGRGAQATLAAANGRFPANRRAGSEVSDTVS